MGSASDWIKQICNQSEALPSSDSDASSTLSFFVLFLKRHFAVENLLCFQRWPLVIYHFLLEMHGL